jgi:hypothetical protein
MMTLPRRLDRGAMLISNYAGDIAPMRLSHDTMLMSSHTDDDTVETTGSQHDVSAESYGRHNL